LLKKFNIETVYLPLDPRFMGSDPVKDDGIFKDDKNP
jgi:hypothetical protein